MRSGKCGASGDQGRTIARYVLALSYPFSGRNDLRLKILPAPDPVCFSAPGENEFAARRHSRCRQFRDMEAEARVARRDVDLGLPVVARVADDRLLRQIEPQRLSGENAGGRAILTPRAAAGGPFLAEVAAHRVRGHVEDSAVRERA